MHFIYYIIDQQPRKWIQLILAIDQHHIAYMSCDERWAPTSDNEITESAAYPLHHTCRQEKHNYSGALHINR